MNYFDCQIFFALQSSAENFCKVASHCRGPSKVLEHLLQNLQDKLIESPAWLLLVFALEFWENDLIYLNIKMPSHYKDDSTKTAVDVSHYSPGVQLHE